MIDVIDELVGTSPDELARGHFDLVICAASWDSRCLAISSMDCDFEHSALLSFVNKGGSGRSAEHLLALQSYLTRTSSNAPMEALIDSREVFRSWASVRVLLLDAYRMVGRPLKVLIDLSSMPRYISLAILGFGARSGVIREFNFVYAAVKEYGTPEDTGPWSDEGNFTTGQWTALPITGLGTGGTGTKRNHLLVSAGFEGSKTRKLVDFLEPDRLSVLVASDGAYANQQRALVENEGLMQSYLVGDAHVLRCPLVGVAATADAIRRALREFVPSVVEETSYLLCGPKPHALALGVSALRGGVSNVYYVVADSHRDTSPREILSYHNVVLRTLYV